MPKPLDQLVPADFASLVGERFTVVQNEGDLALELAEVRPLPPHARRAEPFALLFHGPAQPRLSQRVHTLAHVELGLLSMFLVPVDPRGASAAYEAVFN